jgi:hypothetical protein
MCEIILLTGETADDAGKERWYSDEYVAKQIKRLQNGECCIVWFAFVKFHAAQLAFSAFI